ncbi:MAG: hypothetical protein MJ131_08730 [Lachnospiraceae bacterium]|nr:hypothetical protein [Lachnospiraceae bacterium]
MKKLAIIIMFLSLSLLGFTFEAKAAENVLDSEDVLSKSHDFEEIKALEPFIIQSAKEACNLNNTGFSADDIIVDYDNAIRVYTDCLVFEDREVSADRVDEIIEYSIDKMYFGWQIPVYSESKGKTVGVLVARQLPLNEDAKAYMSEDLQKAIMETEGKYKVSTAEVLDERATIMLYVKNIENSLPDGSKVRIFGSQPGFFQPVAAVITKGRISSLFPLGYTYSVEEYIDFSIENGKFYDYELLYPAIEDIRIENEKNAALGLQTGAGTGIQVPHNSSITLIVILSIAGVLTAGALAGIMIAKKRRVK